MIEIIIIILLLVAGFSVFKKIKEFWKDHKFLSILFAIIIMLSFGGDIFGIIIAVITCVLIYKFTSSTFYDNNKVIINYVLISTIVTLLLNLVNKKLAHVIGILAIVVPIVIFIIYTIYKRVAYKPRVEKHLAEYINNINDGIDNQNLITEASFFSHPQTQSLLAEGHDIDGVSAEDFMKATLRNFVIDGIKKRFTEEFESSKNKNSGKIFFYYDYSAFLPYLEEQNIHLTEIIDSFGILNTTYWYIEDLAFFSDLLLKNLMSVFKQKLITVPELAEVPFSKEFLLNYMQSCKFLDRYISETDLDCLRDNPELFEDDFNYLYLAMTNTELDISIEKNWIKAQPDINKNNEYLYSLNHEDENGIVREEYGQQFEQHRVSFDEDLSANQINELKGCPV